MGIGKAKSPVLSRALSYAMHEDVEGEGSSCGLWIETVIPHGRGEAAVRSEKSGRRKGTSATAAFRGRKKSPRPEGLGLQKGARRTASSHTSTEGTTESASTPDSENFFRLGDSSGLGKYSLRLKLPKVS